MISANHRLKTTFFSPLIQKRTIPILCWEDFKKGTKLPPVSSDFLFFFSAPVGTKQSISGHSFRRRDGRTPAGSEPQRGRKKKAIDRQRAEAVKILFPSGRGGLWGSAEGCQIRYRHIKTRLGEPNSRGMTWSLGQKTKSALTQK